MEADTANLEICSDHLLTSDDGFNFLCSCGLKIVTQLTAQQHVIQALHGIIDGLRDECDRWQRCAWKWVDHEETCAHRQWSYYNHPSDSGWEGPACSCGLDQAWDDNRILEILHKRYTDGK
jgi:hypothetical protein